MSRKGSPYDNALMESFYKTIERELINDANFTDVDQAQQEIFKYSKLELSTLIYSYRDASHYHFLIFLELLIAPT